MTYMDRALFPHPGVSYDVPPRQPLVLIVEDGQRLTDAFRLLCECLEVAVERVSTHVDLRMALQQRRPMAVVAEMDGEAQDGCHVLMTVAAYDRSLPTLLITGNDGALLGAADAVEEIWGLSSVTKRPDLPGIGEMVNFLFLAGQKGRCLRLLPG